MPPKLDIKQKLIQRSKRVKCVDLHPTEPWLLSALYTGKMVIYNYKTNTEVRSFDVCPMIPIRSAKFIARKNWIVCGTDEFKIVVFNYNTSEKVTEFEAHQDYLRSIAVHPTLPYIITSSDDLQIRLWNWDMGWKHVRTFDEHKHYIMQVTFNPKDPNVFASASLDGTIKVWNINKRTPNFTLEGHSDGVNCIAFYHGSDKPFLVSGSDDNTVKVWDYQTKSCVQTLEGHSENVTVVCFHPRLNYIIAGSEDHTINIWNGSTYQLEETFDANLERVWAIGYTTNTYLALGYDHGTVVLRLAKDLPVVALDRKGKVTWIKDSQIEQFSVKQTGKIVDGEKLLIQPKDKGVPEIPAHEIKYSTKGNYLSFVSDRDWATYSAVSLRNKTYGNGVEFIWGPKPGQYAVRERGGKVKIFKNFQLVQTLKVPFSAQQIFGGNFLGIRSSEFFCFFDWETSHLIQSIEILPKSVFWSETGEQVILADEESWYVLNVHHDIIKSVLKADSNPDDGIEGSIELQQEFTEKIKQGQWVGDCFIYTNSDQSLNYYIGKSTETISRLDKSYTFLGYVSKYNRVYLMDKDYNIISYQLHVSVMQYEAAIAAGDLEAADQFLKQVPKEFHNKLAHFLDRQNNVELKKVALELTSDLDHKFQLALELNQFDIALEITNKEPSSEKWKRLGGLALAECNFVMAEDCLLKGKDFPGLLLLYTSTGNLEGIKRLATLTLEEGKNNIAFMCLILSQNKQDALKLLIETKRLPEAAFFARTYLPSQVSNVVSLWKEDLKKVSEKASEALADPIEFNNFFPGFETALENEKLQVELMKAENYGQKEE